MCVAISRLCTSLSQYDSGYHTWITEIACFSNNLSFVMYFACHILEQHGLSYNFQMDVILIVVYPSLFYIWMKPMSILHMPFVSNLKIVNWNVRRLDPFGWCQSILDGWVMAEWLACRTQLWVVNRCVKRLRGPKFAAGLSPMKQFAHSWHLSCFQCTETSSYFSSWPQYIYIYT